MGRQTSFFDVERRFEKLNESDRLLPLAKQIPWERFRAALIAATEKPRKSEAGRKPYDPMVMFKALVLQSLYGLSDEQMEYQIRDRLSFTRFLGLGPNDETPDRNTIWLFREALKEARVIEKLFKKFDRYLAEQGLQAKKGTIVDACFVEVPKQHMSDGERALVKEGKTPEDWNEAKQGQKDVDARWALKNGKSFFGYKNHIAVDRKNKLIRKWTVTNAAQHDSTVFAELVDWRVSKQGVWGDPAYDTVANEKFLKRGKCKNRIQKQARGSQVLKASVVRKNWEWSQVRKRVEHVFGYQTNSMAGRFIRTIGLARAYFRVGLNNLTYNFMRFLYLKPAAA